MGDSMGQLKSANETVIFPFTKTPLTLKFKLLSATHRAPSTRRLIDNTCHHPPAIHVSPFPSITFQKAIPAIPDHHGRTIVQNILVWQYPSYADGIRDPPERRYCLVEQLETMEDQGSDDVVIGVGQAARPGT